MEKQKDMKGECLPDDTGLSTGNWHDVPENVLLKIFSYVELENLVDLYHAGLTCHRWYDVSTHDLLWENLFKRKWVVDVHIPIRPGASSWRDEYKRLFYHSPLILVDTVEKYKKRVQHVCSSNNGELYATCSFEATVEVWQLQVTKPVLTLKHKVTVGHDWLSAMKSKFNKDDTMLLVIGMVAVEDIDFSGSIAVFSLSDESMSMVCLIQDHPVLMFSDWYDNTSFLHGDFNMHRPTVYKCTISNQGEHRVTGLCRVKNDGKEGLSYLQMALVPQPDKSDVKKYLIYASVSDKYDEEMIWHILHIQLLPGGKNKSIDAPEERTIELAGHIVGSALSPDHKFLYVNVRKVKPKQEPGNVENDKGQSNRNTEESHSSDESQSSDSSYKVPLSKDYTLLVIDMITKSICNEVYQGHKALSYPGTNTHPDVSNHYLASGSQDNAAYIWDRYYGVKLAKLEHDDEKLCVYSSVCFNRKDEEICLSVSDKKSIKVWMSHYRQQEYKKIE